MSSPIHTEPEVFVKLLGAAGLEGTYNGPESVLGCQLQQHVNVVGLSVDLANDNADRLGVLGQPANDVSQRFGGECPSPEFGHEDHVVAEPKHAVILTGKFVVRGEIVNHLNRLYQIARGSVRKIVAGANSTKDFPELPSVISKALIRKYPKAKTIKRVTLPICADRGRQVRQVVGGIYVPCLKANIPCQFQRPVARVLAIEFIKRNRRWYVHVQYETASGLAQTPTDVVGVDFNTRGNIATIAYGQGKVRRLGPDIGSIKFNFRKQRRKHQAKGHTQKAKHVSGKQAKLAREMNHKVSRQIVNIAELTRSAIALEDLHPNGAKSKIRAYVQKSQWAFAQLRSFIEYKAAILGIPVLPVNPAYTSRACSRCGTINKPAGKKFRCDCGYFDHRDANAAHNIRALGKQKTVAERTRNDSSPGAPMAEPKPASKDTGRTLELR